MSQGSVSRHGHFGECRVSLQGLVAADCPSLKPTRSDHINGATGRQTARGRRDGPWGVRTFLGPVFLSGLVMTLALGCRWALTGFQAQQGINICIHVFSWSLCSHHSETLFAPKAVCKP